MAKYPAVQESIAIAEGIVAGRFVAADFGALLTAARASAATLATNGEEVAKPFLLYSLWRDNDAFTVIRPH